MKWAAGLLCLCLAACTQAETELSGEQQGITLTGTVITTSPSSMYSSTYATSVPITEWTATSPLSWPDGATRVQVILRTGEVDAAGSVVTFLGFIVADGNRLDRAYRGRVADQARFRGAIDTAFEVKETPGSGRSHSISGSVYTGPKIGGGPPGGDPLRELPGWYVERIVRSGGAIEDATLLTTDRTL